MPVCWFCGDDVPEVTKCSKCESEYCELHALPNQHDCTGAPVPNPYNIPAERPSPVPMTESEGVVPHEEKTETGAGSTDLESKDDETEVIQQETAKGSMPLEKALAGLKELHIESLKDLVNELNKDVPILKYSTMVKEILETEEEAVRRLNSDFNNLSIGKLTNEMLTLAIGYREKNKLTWDETCDLACSILAIAAPKMFPQVEGEEELMALIALATSVVGKIQDRKGKPSD